MKARVTGVFAYLTIAWILFSSGLAWAQIAMWVF